MKTKAHEDVDRRAKAWRRSNQIQTGAAVGLLEKGTRKIRPEIDALIREAIKRRSDEGRSVRV